MSNIIQFSSRQDLARRDGDPMQLLDIQDLIESELQPPE
jgi:hypothetical protein